MANPVLNNTTFRNIAVESDAGRMSIKGTIYKSLALLLMVFAAGAFTWKVVNESIDPSAYTSWMFGGLIVGFILAMVITFKPKAAPYLSPIYAAAEGLVLGSVSAIYNNAFATTAPNIIINAVLLTMLCAFVMLIFYRTGFVKVNGTFMRVLSVALTTILVFYIGSWILSLFGVDMTLLHGATPLSIGISVIITAVAAFSLIMDYYAIEQSANLGAPKYMEWYCAFGFMVTLIWLYLEILSLLAKIAGSEK